MLQDSLLRCALVFENDTLLGAEVAVAVQNARGEEVVDLRIGWPPRSIYGRERYAGMVLEMKRKRHYGDNAADKAGILRYTKVTDALMDLGDIPAPSTERELAWLVSFHWHLDGAYETLAEVGAHLAEGHAPSPEKLRGLRDKGQAGLVEELNLGDAAAGIARSLGVADG
jgi:hypothetical protein